MARDQPSPVPGTERYCPSCDRSFGPDVQRCPDDDTELVRITTTDPMVGRDLEGRFTIREFLGAGGMGTVYLAWQHSVGRGVALKVIDSRLCRDGMSVRRFLREAKLASRLSQPNTVSVLDFGQTKDGLFFLAMELLRGRTLDQVSAAEGPFAPERLVRVGVQLCDALDAAHALGIVHRDLKPSNVMVLDQPAGRDLVKVLDFGLAKSLAGGETDSTQSGKIIGTPQYMAPEVILGAEADTSSDLYALGVILHELATGEPYLRAASASALYALQVHAPPRSLEGLVPPALEGVVLRLLAKEPAQRYPSARDVRSALTAAVGIDSGPQAVVSGPRPRPRTVSLERPLDPGAAPAPPDAPTVLQPLVRPRAPEAGNPRGRAGPAVIALGLVALGAVGVLLARRESQAPPSVPAKAPATPPAATPTPSAAAPPPAASPAPAARQITLRLEADPPAMVAIDDAPLGKTPILHRRPAGDAALVIVFERDGQRVTRRIIPDRDQTVRAAPGRPRRREAPPTAPPSDRPALPF